MTPSTATLLDDLARLGVRLHRLDDRIGVNAPKGILTDDLRSRIVSRRAELLDLLGNCPGCRRPLDRGRCWRCHWRRCSGCGKDTGSAFIQTCWPCGLNEPEQKEDNPC